MTRATVGKWGKSLAVRIPADLARTAGLGDGTPVEVEARPDAILVRPVAPDVTLRALFAGRTAAQWRAAYAGAYDWGPDVGREAVDE